MDVSRKPWCFPNLGGLHHRSRTAGGEGQDRVLGRRRRAGLGLARALLRLSAAQLDRGIAGPRLPRRRQPRYRLDLGDRSGPGSTTSCRSCSTRKPRCSRTCRRRRPAPPTARRPRPACRSTRCSGAPAARAGCIRSPATSPPMSAGCRPRCSRPSGWSIGCHRAGVAWGTSGSAALCGRYPMPVMKKSQYRWQMTQPVPATTPRAGCNPTGRSSVLWESLRELPVSGESFGYLLWRKRSCCLL